MTLLWGDWYTTVTSLPIGMRSANCQNGAPSTTWNPTPPKHQNLINFRKQGEEHVPLNISRGMWREWPASNHLTWTVSITSRVKKAQQRLHFLKLTCPSSCCCPSITALLKAFSPMTGVVASCTVADNEAVQRIIQSAQKITGTQLHSYTYTDPDAYVEPQT